MSGKRSGDLIAAAIGRYRLLELTGIDHGARRFSTSGQFHCRPLPRLDRTCDRKSEGEYPRYFLNELNKLKALTPVISASSSSEIARSAFASMYSSACRICSGAASAGC